jgi:hypothetical protein
MNSEVKIEVTKHSRKIGMNIADASDIVHVVLSSHNSHYFSSGF